MQHTLHSARSKSTDSDAEWSYKDVRFASGEGPDPKKQTLLQKRVAKELSVRRQSSGGPADTPATRLMHLRIAAGYLTAAEAARNIGVSIVTYHHHENGTRNIGRRSAQIYAKHYGCSPSYLQFGVSATLQERRATVIGAVRAGGTLLDPAHTRRPLPPSVPAPPASKDELQALVVQTAELYPAYAPGDVLFFGAPRKPARAEIDGRECLVETADGLWLLRSCNAEPGGTWTLTDPVGAVTLGARLKSAAPVRWVQKGGVGEG